MSLPDERPSGEVRREALDAARQRSLLALGTQVRVDLPEPSRRGRTAHEATDRGRELLGFREVSGRGPLVDEEDVEVAGVRQLSTTEATEGDHGERQRRIEGLERDLERCLGERAHIAAHGCDIGLAEDVARGDAHEMTLLPPPQAGLAFFDVVTPRQRLPRALDQRRLRARAQLLEIRQPRDEVGVVQQGVRDHPARSDQRADASRCLR